MKFVSKSPNMDRQATLDEIEDNICNYSYHCKVYFYPDVIQIGYHTAAEYHCICVSRETMELIYSGHDSDDCLAMLRDNFTKFKAIYLADML